MSEAPKHFKLERVESVVLGVNIDNRSIMYKSHSSSMSTLQTDDTTSKVLLKYQYMYQGPYSPPFIFSKLINWPNKLECYIK